MRDDRKSGGHAAAVPEVIFTGCNAIAATPHQPHAGGRRRQVVVNGRRIKTVDAHAHCAFAEALTLMGEKPTDLRPGETFEEMERDRIREMDEQGIDVEALSTNPFWYTAKRDLAAEVIKVHNGKMAEFCGRHADRLVGFAGVALQHPDLAVQQLEHAVRKLGMRGVAVGGNVEGEDFSEAKFHPFWAKCEELDVLVFIHPLGVAELAPRLKGNGWLRNVIGNPLDTTIALSHLIFEGTLDRFPRLKILAAHGGGFLPFYAARSDAAPSVPCPPGRKQFDPAIVLKKKPTEYLRQIYFDSLVFTPEALQFLAQQVGPSQIVIGSDHPVGWVKNPVDHILNTPGFSDAERAAMLGETAARLLGIG